jgi:hypothetical protein
MELEGLLQKLLSTITPISHEAKEFSLSYRNPLKHTTCSSNCAHIFIGESDVAFLPHHEWRTGRVKAMFHAFLTSTSGEGE